MVCEVSVLNLFSPKPDIIRLPLSYLYLSSPGTFSRSLGKGYLSSVHTAKGNSGPIWVLCDINHRLSLHGCCCRSATSDSQINMLHFHRAFDGQRRCFHNRCGGSHGDSVCRSGALQAPQLLLVTPTTLFTGIAKKQRRTIAIAIFSCWDKYPLV